MPKTRFEIYIINHEHYADITANIAVKRADKKTAPAIAKRGYLIGELYRFMWRGSKIILKNIFDFS